MSLIRTHKQDGCFSCNTCPSAIGADGRTWFHEQPRLALRRRRDYLAACTLGLPSRETCARRPRGSRRPRHPVAPDVVAASQAVEDARASYARLVRRAAGDVGNRLADVGAGRAHRRLVPDGAEVLCAEGDFSSLVAPFAPTRVEASGCAPLPSRSSRPLCPPTPGLVAFSLSLVQSATGDVADAVGIAAAAAARAGARTLCDLTQAAGWLPVDATMFDATRVPRLQVAVLPPRRLIPHHLTPAFAHEIRTVQAGWNSATTRGRRVTERAACSPPTRAASTSRRRGRPSSAPLPPWLCSPMPTSHATYSHTTGLAARFRDGLALAHPDRPSAIVTWPEAPAKPSRSSPPTASRRRAARVAPRWPSTSSTTSATTSTAPCMRSACAGSRTSRPSTAWSIRDLTHSPVRGAENCRLVGSKATILGTHARVRSATTAVMQTTVTGTSAQRARPPYPTRPRITPASTEPAAAHAVISVSLRP